MKDILFKPVICDGFLKPVHDGIYVYLDKTTMTAYAMNSNLIDDNNDGTVESDIDCTEKTYYEYVQRKFNGIVVGIKDIITQGYLDVNYEDYDSGYYPYDDYHADRYYQERFFVSKRPKTTVKCAIVYYANNKKHLVPYDKLTVKNN